MGILIGYAEKRNIGNGIAEDNGEVSRSNVVAIGSSDLLAKVFMNYITKKEEIKKVLAANFRNYELVQKEIIIETLCGGKYPCRMGTAHDSVASERQQWNREYVLKKAIKYGFVKFRQSHKKYQIRYLCG